jgi:hypothetical protein
VIQIYREREISSELLDYPKSRAGYLGVEGMPVYGVRTGSRDIRAGQKKKDKKYYEW